MRQNGQRSNVRFPYGSEGMKKVAVLRNKATKIEKMNLSQWEFVRKELRSN